MTVVSGFAVWKPAIQASWAAPIDEAPTPTSEPESDEAASVVSAVPPSFAAQEVSARSAMPPIAAALIETEVFTVCRVRFCVL